MANNNENKESRFEKVRPVLQLGITSLIEFFVEGTCSSILSHVSANKFAKFGARIGAGLLGLLWGSQVTDFICDETDEFLNDLDDVKKAIDEAKEAK